ncbi:major facilitator superfamily domain-containing protein [Halenospora varia]|nr:major facilitator superfamily domain-containing protein [Halenospora varia]
MHSQDMIEILPGTEVMKDHDGIHLIHANNAAQGPVLLPIPSEYSHDPLNWSKLWKTITALNQGIFVILSVVTNLSIAPLTPIYMAEWNKSLSQVALLTGACVIALGYANFIIVPAADVFGRRPVTLICGAICIASNIWSAAAKSYGSFLGSRVLGGLGAAANESIMTMVVADIFFLHERGAFVGLYFWCYFMGLFVGPIISGNIAARVSWRWFFWACTIAQALNVIAMVFLLPETRRPREMQVVQTRGTCDQAGPQTSTEKADEAQIETANSVDIVLVDQYLAFAAPPYNWPPGSVGFANFALVVGGVVGLAVAGPWSDWVIIRATKKNNGVREPEMRLAALYPFIASALIGLTIVGVGFDRHWPWQVIIVLGFGLVGVQVVSIPTIAVTYAIDCYKPIAGQIMVISTVCKNTFGFGMTYYYNDWAAKEGFTPPLMMIMGMTVGFSLLGTVAFPFVGKMMRRWTRASKVHGF